MQVELYLRGSARRALAAIAAKGARFVSRGDKSGTHVAEMNLWAAAGLMPSGAWYEVYEKGSEGNSATLKHAGQRQAYTLIDRATWLSLRRDLDLAVLVEKDEALLNYMSLIPVSPRKFPKVNHQGAMAFAAWLTDPRKGQKLIQPDRGGAGEEPVRRAGRELIGW